MSLKVLKKKFLTQLPQKYRQLILQSALKINYNISDSYSFRLASTPEDFKAVGRLIHDRYANVGISEHLADRSRHSIYQVLPNAAVLLMCYKDNIIGTVTLIGDSTIGLPSEKNSDISELKKIRRCCEISCLAIDTNYKGKNLIYLFKYLYEIATNVLRVEYLIISTTQKSKSAELLYGPILLFQDAYGSKTYNYKDANNEPCKTQVLNLKNAPHFYKSHYGSKKSKNNLYYFFRKHKTKNFNLNYKIDTPNPITYEAAFEVILNNSFVKKQITSSLALQILSLYSGSPYEEKIKEYLQSYLVRSDIYERKNQRFPCNDKALILYSDKYEQATVINRSEEGMLIQSTRGKSIKQKEFKILILHNNNKLEKCHVIKVWHNDNLIGLKFIP